MAKVFFSPLKTFIFRLKIRAKQKRKDDNFERIV